MKINKSVEILSKATEIFNPTHIFLLVSGGKDSAVSDQIVQELSVEIDTVIHRQHSYQNAGDELFRP